MPTLSGKSLVDAIVISLQSSLALDIVIIQLNENHNTGKFDWCIICESDNDAHIRACAYNIISDLSDQNIKPWQKEGLDEGRWVLLDFSDVVVHIMLDELRSYYQLEKLFPQNIITQINSTT